jgi:hypothetical protein
MGGQVAELYAVIVGAEFYHDGKRLGQSRFYSTIR